jgi:hypothetical protein
VVSDPADAGGVKTPNPAKAHNAPNAMHRSNMENLLGDGRLRFMGTEMLAAGHRNDVRKQGNAAGRI